MTSSSRHLHTYRGVDIDADLAPLIRHMPSVDATRETLLGLQGIWDSLSMLSELSGTGVEIAGVRAAFSKLMSTLVDQLGHQARDKAALQQAIKAQVTIDILVRNLFERTADIGFLATDEDLRRFASADEASRAAQMAAIKQRLSEYQSKYSVYDDIILLTPEGRVLSRLDGSVTLERTQDAALLSEALSTAHPYVEIYRAFDLRPAASRSLVYACRMMDATGQRVIGVLCLCFRFEDECQRIFRKFVGVNDWGVVALLDGAGCAIASSDPFQVPLGAQIGAPNDGRTHLVRFAGRRWLAVSCAAHAFQGYVGPGWMGHAMVPLEHAFDDAQDQDAGKTPQLDAATLDRLHASRVLYPDALRDIANAAHRIESDLARAVWNGNLALLAAADGQAQNSTHNVRFSRTLLLEINRTGARTRDGFTQALSEMSGSIGAATLAGTCARASLAIDIMDRSLYERANDCRWWALTTAFRTALEAPNPADETPALERILRAIHGLYTVYANLVLFDREARIIAASVPSAATAPGQRLDAEWARRTLTLPNTQSYCVSAFEPSALYDGRSTYIYAAAVRGLSDAGRVVGGIAIVFDSQPQFRSMLQDTLPRNPQGTPLEGAFGVFLDRGGRVIACSHDTPAIGSLFNASPEGGVVHRERRWWAQGAARSTGYREFKSTQDAYREEVTALMLEALTDIDDHDAAAAALHPPAKAPPKRNAGQRLSPLEERIDLALLRIGNQWHAMTGRDLVEAIRADAIVPLPGSPPCVRGSVMHRNTPIVVLDIEALLSRSGRSNVPTEQQQIVVLRSPQEQGRMFGLLVDELGDNPEVSPNQLVRLTEGIWQRSPAGMPLIDTVVAPAAGATDRELLTLLSTQALASLLSKDNR
jgi:chemotaxis signal transduction protein